jgi:hypothetical protein
VQIFLFKYRFFSISRDDSTGGVVNHLLIIDNPCVLYGFARA